MDTGAILKSDDGIFKNDLVTVPEVLRELKDRWAQERNDRLEIIVPKQSSLCQVVQFSKKTGDYAQLSVADLRLLALAYEVAVQHGLVLSSEPVVKVAAGGSGHKHELQGFYDGPMENDEGWITPGNKTEEIQQDQNMEMACMTTDFAMQNVLLQMGVPLMSVDNIQIKEVKSFVLRCHACFSICKNMQKKFCQKCGGQTLIRTSYSLGENGEVVYHLKKNFQYRLRGTIHSLPAPQGGQHSQNVIVREDQKENIVKERKLRRQKEKIDDDGFAPFTKIRTFRK